MARYGSCYWCFFDTVFLPSLVPRLGPNRKEEDVREAKISPDRAIFFHFEDEDAMGAYLR